MKKEKEYMKNIQISISEYNLHKVIEMQLVEFISSPPPRLLLPTDAIAMVDFLLLWKRLIFGL